MEQWKIGDIVVTKIPEIAGWFPIDLWFSIMPECTREAVEQLQWLTPSYRRGDEINLSIHALLVETPTHKIVIDTGVGNAKRRNWELFNELDTDFLARLDEVCPRSEVDMVICTHLHNDHVGWNTQFVDGRWVPTYPDARYCFVRSEYDYWTKYVNDPATVDSYTEFAQVAIDGQEVYRDSIAPIVEAGLVDWVEPDREVVPGVTLLSTPGHTPGHVSVLLQSGDQSAVISGDVFHTQAQVGRLDWSVQMDSAPDEAAETRRTFLDRFADTSTLVLGTHFGTPTGNYIRRDGDSFKLVPVES
ncbi:MBL fold metallo-hydrolase [Rhodococcus sp. NPDC127530]|uniref:MBL fold metallo-hydrolase n=1 Tax=unclassified Rhodococcus (in: high G+C Gram-positive bacteria) TaxID=192944 RepID=UPI00362C65C2